ncbi:RagB/SusD family nutrient uptake outer membrane protein [Roseimarinus sediminis]|uniref:RagB/SusD family nutrient uptake outer membrane protein n=1 Tax=Roseimarinus sediminis TaxID=1610899 RepID=UPI003D190173
MKAYPIILLIAALFTLSSCGDEFLTVYPTEKQEAGGAATEGAILSNLAASYQLLLFDSYANNNYNSIPLMSDLRSDDIYKGGGDAGDQHQLYLLSQFTASADEGPFGLWNIYYTGLARANNVIMACDNAVDVDPEKLEQFRAEAHFLRAYYMHWLWKFWGNIPYFEEPLEEPYLAPQYTADQIYAEIMEDLDFACTEGKMPMAVSGNDLGRANRAAALMLKARVVMYQNDESRYAEVTADMAEIISSGSYSLLNDFEALWLDENEFCVESIFESNQLPEGKNWASGWQGYGTNLPAFISPNALEVDADAPVGTPKGGWGFGPVRTSAYAMYEDGDTRREGSINQFDQETYTIRFQDTGLFMAKYAARVGYNPPPGDQDLNYANNFRIFRYAEALLNYAELVVVHGQSPVGGITAQDCIDQIRVRAKVPGIDATAENIKLERRREFLGEGIRFWDVVRWGDTNLLNDNDDKSQRTWKDSQKYLPIPQSEIDKTAGTEFELVQNPL